MPTITITLSGEESDQNIHQNILRSLATRLTAALYGAAPAIRSRIQLVCVHLVENTPTYRSLLHGELLGELGIPDVEGRLRTMLETIREGVTVGVSPVRIVQNKLKGGLQIGILRNHFADLLNLPEATYYSNEYQIPWLDWLIVQGDRIIVLDYSIERDLTPQQRARSRTGQALMFPSPRGWRVPPEWAGTEESNFLTKVFDDQQVMETLGDIVVQEVVQRI